MGEITNLIPRLTHYSCFFFREKLASNGKYSVIKTAQEHCNVQMTAAILEDRKDAWQGIASRQLGTGGLRRPIDNTLRGAIGSVDAEVVARGRAKCPLSLAVLLREKRIPIPGLQNPEAFVFSAHPLRVREPNHIGRRPGNGSR